MEKLLKMIMSIILGMSTGLYISKNFLYETINIVRI